MQQWVYYITWIGIGVIKWAGHSSDHASIGMMGQKEREGMVACGVRSCCSKGPTACYVLVGDSLSLTHTLLILSLSSSHSRFTFLFLFVCAVYTSLIKLVTETIR